MDALVVLAVIVVIVVLIFDYTNGFHDASNIIATVIASRAMTPVQAVIIVATFEFLGPLLGGTAVANTIGKFVAGAAAVGIGAHAVGTAVSKARARKEQGGAQEQRSETAAAGPREQAANEIQP